MFLRQPHSFIVEESVMLAECGQVHSCECRYDARQYSDTLFPFLGIVFPPSLASAVPKRKAEYLAGRYAARLALRALGHEGSQIGSGADRAPRWPEYIIGAITHTADLAISSVASSHRMLALGVDAEDTMSAGTANEIASSITTYDERACLAGTERSLAQGMTLALSAKESLYKALSPQVGRFFDFSVARLMSVDEKAAQLTMELTEDLSPRWRAGTSISASFAPTDSGVSTRVAIPRP
jgi:enterobactin synthetase component D